MTKLMFIFGFVLIPIVALIKYFILQINVKKTDKSNNVAIIALIAFGVIAFGILLCLASLAMAPKLNDYLGGCMK